MKILVTGGAGFIGSNLVESLVKENHEVSVVDNLFLGVEKNIASVITDIDFVKGDIRDLELMIKLCKGVDVVLHQAAASSSPMFKEKLKEAVDVNVQGTINVLQAAVKNNVKRVIIASTSSIYANNKPPLKESMKVDPPNFYSATKLIKENLSRLFSQEYGIDTLLFRYMSIYGHNEKSKGIYANLASQFLWRIQNNERPIIYGNGKQTRDFTYVKDVVRAHTLAIKSKKRFDGEVFNVGTGRELSLNEVVFTINRILGKNIKPETIKNPVKNYIRRQCADISKIKRILGYRPKYTLEKGLTEMINL